MIMDDTTGRRHETDIRGRFVRLPSVFRDWITADGSSEYPPGGVVTTCTSPTAALGASRGHPAAAEAARGRRRHDGCRPDP